MSLSLEFAVILSCLALFVACGAAVFAYTLTRELVGVHEVAGVKASLEGMSERISSQQREMHFVRESLGRVESYLLNHDNK